ncbi:MAG: phosphonoacetaldehyde reductase [Clostridium sp.]|nr:phosphonoacetaldehyde reductase [Clostridium sp.]
MKQQLIKLSNGDEPVIQYLKDMEIKKMLLVCGSSVSKLEVYKHLRDILEKAGTEIFRFSGFKPNPEYASVVDGVRTFCENACDGVMAIGGGSAMDVAKCIKLYARLNIGEDFLKQKYEPNHIPFIAAPTTAGSGSEATRFAVIYRDGVKLSISDESAIPSCVILSSDTLDALPEYQKKATVMDALCHCMESVWSVNATEESKTYAFRGIKLIFQGIDGYLSGDNSKNDSMMEASYAAGKAINITQTTAGHAMAYKLTGIYGFAHGHAVALCIDRILPYMLKNLDQEAVCIDKRGMNYLRETLLVLAQTMGGNCIEDMQTIFHGLMVKLDLDTTVSYSEEELETLTRSVNVDRLKNHPMELGSETIKKLYEEMMK